MITFRQKGDFSKLTRFLERAKESVRLCDLDKYGREGVAALASATPVDTGRTANSWHYKIEQKQGSVSISFYNTNIQNGVPIAVRTRNKKRRLGTGARLHQSCYPAYF